MFHITGQVKNGLLLFFYFLNDNICHCGFVELWLETNSIMRGEQMKMKQKNMLSKIIQNAKKIRLESIEEKTVEIEKSALDIAKEKACLKRYKGF